VDGAVPHVPVLAAKNVSDFQWSPGGERISYSMSQVANDGARLQVREWGTGTLIAVAESGASLVELGPWSPDGRHLFFSSANGEDVSTLSPWVFSLSQQRSQPLGLVEGYCQVCDASRSGRLALVNQRLDRNRERLWLVDWSNRRLELVTEDEFQFGGRVAVFDSATRDVVYISNAFSERRALHRRRLGPLGNLGPVRVSEMHPELELEQFALLGRERILAVWNAAGASLAEVRREGSIEAPQSQLLAGLVVLGIAASSDGARVALNASGPGIASNIWVYDVRDRPSLVSTTAPETAQTLSARISAPRLLALTAEDGTRLTAWLYLPDDTTRPMPVVISVHGGPEGQERPVYNPLYQALLAEGVAVLGPNIRGSAGFFRSFTRAGDRAERELAIDDIAAWARDIVHRGIGRSDSIALFGVSYGGYVTLASVVRHQALFCAAAVISAITDFETYFESTNGWLSEASVVKYGSPSEDSALLRRLSILRDSARIHTPLCIFHGARDTNVPVTEARQLVDALATSDTLVEYTELPDEGHGIHRLANRMSSVRKMVSWFGRHFVARSRVG
jgi:dipeptidyl aminopeptidase/acylaminoacyl peptidase